MLKSFSKAKKSLKKRKILNDARFARKSKNILKWDFCEEFQTLFKSGNGGAWIFCEKKIFCVVCPAMESLTGGVAIGAGPGGGRPIVGGFLGQKLQVPRMPVFT